MIASYGEGTAMAVFSTVVQIKVQLLASTQFRNWVQRDLALNSKLGVVPWLDRGARASFEIRSFLQKVKSGEMFASREE